MIFVNIIRSKVEKYHLIRFIVFYWGLIWGIWIQTYHLHHLFILLRIDSSEYYQILLLLMIVYCLSFYSLTWNIHCLPEKKFILQHRSALSDGCFYLTASWVCLIVLEPSIALVVHQFSRMTIASMLMHYSLCWN